MALILEGCKGLVVAAAMVAQQITGLKGKFLLWALKYQHFNQTELKNP